VLHWKHTFLFSTHIRVQRGVQNLQNAQQLSNSLSSSWSLVMEVQRLIQFLDNTQVRTASFVGSKERISLIIDSGNLLLIMSLFLARAFFILVLLVVPPLSMSITISFQWFFLQSLKFSKLSLGSTLDNFFFLSSRIITKP